MFGGMEAEVDVDLVLKVIVELVGVLGLLGLLGEGRDFCLGY